MSTTIALIFSPWAWLIVGTIAVLLFGHRLLGLLAGNRAGPNRIDLMLALLLALVVGILLGRFSVTLFAVQEKESHDQEQAAQQSSEGP